MALAGALVGCVYTPETTVKVRDPSAVQIDVEDDHGNRVTVLPPGATAGSAVLPSTSPPWDQGLRPTVALGRLAAGPIAITCAECSPRTATLVTMDGQVNLSDPYHFVSHPWTKGELRFRFRDRREGQYGTTTSYSAEVVTPWSNVAEVVRVETPNRGLGFKLVASAAVLAVLGGFALEDGLSLHHSATTAFAAVILPISIPLGAGGVWYLAAPPEEHVLFGGK